MDRNGGIFVDRPQFSSPLPFLLRCSWQIPVAIVAHRDSLSFSTKLMLERGPGTVESRSNAPCGQNDHIGQAPRPHNLCSTLGSLPFNRQAQIFLIEIEIQARDKLPGLTIRYSSEAALALDSHFHHTI